jgi:hypothetical protein
MESRHRIDPNAFIADIRTRYGANLPFLISRLSIQRTARDISRIRPAQENVAATDGMVVVTATISRTPIDRLFVDVKVVQNHIPHHDKPANLNTCR